jgi:hypothetical protein
MRVACWSRTRGTTEAAMLRMLAYADICVCAYVSIRGCYKRFTHTCQARWLAATLNVFGLKRAAAEQQSNAQYIYLSFYLSIYLTSTEQKCLLAPTLRCCTHLLYSHTHNRVQGYEELCGSLILIRFQGLMFLCLLFIRKDQARTNKGE